MAVPIRLDVLHPASCDHCGLCCEGIGSPVLIYASRPAFVDHHPFRPAGMPPALIHEIDEHFAGLTRGQEPQERCLWFDAKSRRCKHYDWRPQICRDYELGGTACLLRRQDHANSTSRTSAAWNAVINSQWPDGLFS